MLNQPYGPLGTFSHPRESFGLTAGVASFFACASAGPQLMAAIHSYVMKLSVRLRTGDWAILVGAAAIAVYEKQVRDDEDLISRRVAAYRTTRHGRVLADFVILATALHLAEAVEPEWDVYCWLMRWVRRATTETVGLAE